MKLNHIELGYDTYYWGCIYGITEITVYVLIPKFLNPKINPEKLKLKEDLNDVNILGLEKDTKTSDYDVYEYYKTFESIAIEPSKCYRQIYPDIIDILKMK